MATSLPPSGFTGPVPEVHYTGPAGESVAYQMWGDGDVDMVLMTNWRTSVDNSWEHPGRVRLLALQGSLARVVRFDPRGFGASDPLEPNRIGDLSLWVEDALRVLDALGVERVVITAEAFAAQAAILLAARHPELIERIAFLNPYARLAHDESYPIGHSQSVLSSIARQVADEWGRGTVTASLVPTLASENFDPGFLGRTERSSASRAAAAAMMAVDVASDVRDFLGEVEAPGLVLHTGDHALVSADMSRYVADHLPQARFVQATSRTFYWGDPSFDDYAEFISGTPQEDATREITAILYTDIVGSTTTAAALADRRWRQVLDGLDDFAKIEAARGGGRVVKWHGDGHLIVFSDPAAAVRTAMRIIAGAQTFEVRLRAGIHIGSVEHRRDDIAGIAVHIAQRVSALAQPSELLVSRTVADVLAGSSYKFEPRGDHQLKGVTGTWTLYATATLD